MSQLINIFFQRTKWLWIVTRTLLIVLFIIAIAKSESLANLHTGSIAYFLASIYVISLLIILSEELIKTRSFKILHYLTGTFSVIFGIIISYLLISNNDFQLQNILVQVVPVWMIAFGIYDLKKKP